MGTIYRKRWTATNGHIYQLDIVPYDTDTDDTNIVTLSEADANLIEVGTLTYAFDELPVGLMTPPSLTCKVVINRLPSALQSALRAKFIEFAGPGGYVSRNTFILQSNYGSGEPTNVMFVGVQSRINSQSYDRQNGEYIVEIELQDAVQWTMASTKPSDSTDWLTLNGSTRKEVRQAFEFRAPNSDGLYDSVYDTSLSQLDERLVFHSWSESMGAIWKYLDTAAKRSSLRCTSPIQVICAGDKWKGSDPLAILQLYTATGWTPANGRPRNTVLDNDGVYLCTHITKNGQTVGGLSSADDKYGWSKYESWWDCFKDLSENMFLKVSYSYSRDTFIEPGVLRVGWEIRPVISTNISTVDVAKSLAEPAVEETASAIGRSEVRYETEYGDATVTQLIANAGVNRADRQYTVELAMHNNVLFKGKRDNTQFFGTANNPYIAEPGLQHCNMFWCFDGTYIVKVHENLRIKWGATSGDVFDYDAPIAEDPPFDKEQHALWCIAVQRATGIPYALANSYTNIFGDDDIATVELQTRIADYRLFVGDRHTLSGAITTDIPHLAWGNAVVTSVETDIMSGMQTVTFMLIPTP